MIPSIKPRLFWYHDPVTTLIMKLPLMSRDVKKRWARQWGEHLPSILVRRCIAEYRDRDRSVLTTIEFCMAIGPIVLTALGVPVTYTLATALATFIIHSRLRRGYRKRENERVKKDTKQELEHEKWERTSTDPLAPTQGQPVYRQES